MALLVCPECSGKVSEYAEFCPHCGCLSSIIKNSRIQREMSTPSVSKIKGQCEMLIGATVKNYDSGIESKITKIENGVVYLAGGGGANVGRFLRNYKFLDSAKRDIFKSIFSDDILAVHMELDRQEKERKDQNKLLQSLNLSFPSSDDDYFYEEETDAGPDSLSAYYYDYHSYDG